MLQASNQRSNQFDRFIQFLVDRTNGRAIGTVLRRRLSSVT